MIPDLNSKEKIKLEYGKINLEKKIIDEIYFNFLIKDLQKYINYSYGYKIYNYKLFNKSFKKNINCIFHTNRYPDLNTLSLIFSKLKIKQHLISHGTHTRQDDHKLGNLISESLAVGMLVSRIPGIKIYSQTKFSDDYLSTNRLKQLIPKFSQYLLESDKKYRTQIRLGVTTDTGDAEGAVISEASTASIGAA